MIPRFDPMTFEIEEMKPVNDVYAREELRMKLLANKKKQIEEEMQFTIAGTKKEYQLKRQLLDTQEQMDLQKYQDNEEMKTEIMAFYARQRTDLEADSLEKMADKFQMYFNAVMQINNALLASSQIKTENEISLAKKEEKERLERLESRLKKEQITQEEYLKKKEQIEAEFREKEKNLKQEQWHKEQNARIAQAIADGIVATVKAYTKDPTGVMAGIVGITNAILIGNLIAQPMPEFASGGRTVKGMSGRSYYASNAGSLANGGRFDAPSYGIVGERGPELVIPNNIYQHPKMANTMAMLETMIGVREYASGGRTAQSSGTSPELMGLIASNTMVMNMLMERLNAPIEAVAYLNPVKADEYERQLDTVKTLSKLSG